MGSVSTIHGNLDCIIYDTTCQKGLKSNKSPGYDDISSNAVNAVTNEVFPTIKHSLNISLQQRVFPGKLKIACVTPISKMVINL